MELNINKKDFPIGSVVYFVESKGNRKYVKYGIVAENYTDTICVQLIEFKDMRLINGVPVKEFKTPTEWKKLPKNWDFRTELFELKYDYGDSEEYEKIKGYNARKPEDILKAYKEGILVNVQDNDHAHFETEIDSNKGWRIRRNYPMYEHHPTYVSLDYHFEAYKTYEEAQQVVIDYENELKRQSELSDYDWSVEQIQNDINRWSKIYSKSEEEKQEVLEYILGRGNVEEIETRVCYGNIQWKYCKNKKWMSVIAGGGING